MTSEYLYINNIDNCVDNVFDTFYQELLNNKKFKNNIISLDYIINNFQKILELIEKIIKKSIDSYKIRQIVNDDYEYIYKIIYEYLLLYLCFYLVFFHELKDIIILLNKLNLKYKLDFFNNKYLTKYNIYYSYIKKYYFVFKNKNKIESNDDENFINEYQEFIERIKMIDINVLNNLNEDEIMHNILKIVIYIEIYIKEDKALIFKILEKTELKNIEYKYIEIINSKFDIIDYALIESLFTIKDIKMGISEEMYQLLNEYESNKIYNDYNINFKINTLFEKNILIPITDDFLRYHKESEKYENNNNTTKIETKYRTNKKDNTKIKYIITKINKVKEYYLDNIQNNKELKSEIDKYFYQPLIYRKLILLNDLEEINILRKLELQDISLLENNSFYNDLTSIRNYAYIDFKFLKKDYFSFSTDNTINAIRYCNIEYKNDIRFNNIDKSNLQHRIINSNMKVNIVGIAIPKKNFLKNKKTYIQCTNVKDIFDTRLIGNNCYSVILKKLKNIFMENSKYSKLLYWIFDKKNDLIKLDIFNNINILSTDEYIKLLLGSIYDFMVDIVFNLIISEINNFNNINVEDSKKIITFYEKNLVYIPRESSYYSKLMKFIYYIKPTNNFDINDSNEENLLNNNIILLPKVLLKKIKLHIINIKKKEILEISDNIDIYEDYTCQHIITWNNLKKIKKIDTNRFNEELYNFIKKYVTINIDDDFICKSCFQQVDITKYTTEIYPGSTSIAITYGLDTDLETIQEYTKYNKSIKNIEKLIEKITYSANIQYLSGSDQQTKLRRQEIVKNIIDIIELQYKTLYTKDQKLRKERITQVIKDYGCTYTNFFLFKLDNDIFTYSSKEIDKFKMFKLNNIYIYIIIYLIIELNLSQILNFSFDKFINYFIFDKYAFNLFNNLYIRISSNDIFMPIKNYKLLCYVIYYISGLFIKYNIWFSDNIDIKKNIINEKIQKLIIHTFIDAINTILQNNNKSYIYDTFSIKFYNKLNTVFNNTNLLELLNNLNKKKISVIDNKLKYTINKIDPILIQPYDDNNKYMLLSSLNIKEKITSYPSLKKYYKNIIIKTREDILGNKTIEELNKKLYNDTLNYIGKIYDKEGNKRKNILSDTEIKNISIKELKEINEISSKIRIKNFNKIINKIEIKKKKLETEKLNNLEYIEKFSKIYNKDLEFFNENFINKLENIIGKNININNNNIYLNENCYEIDHNYLGKKIKSIFFTENDNIIKIKKNDSIFKQDVFYYEDTNNKITLYYSYIEKYLLGYKENSKDYILLNNTNCYIKINYSIQNRLKYLGFNYIFYKVDNKNLSVFVNNILRTRLQNLKNCISYIQQIIYQIKFESDSSNVNPIAKFYQNKIKLFNTYDENNNRIFKDWNIINNNLYYKNIKNNYTLEIKEQNHNKYINTDNLIKLISNNDIILYYIIEQFNLLLDINDEIYTKSNLTYLIINIIIYLFNNFNKFETSFNDLNVKIFYQFILNKIDIAHVSDDFDISNMSIDEIENLKEELDIDKERDDAIDADQDEINEDFGDEDILLVDRTSGEY